MRGHIRQWRKAGTYKVWLEHPTVAGRRKRETFVVHGSKKGAEAKMAERISAIERSDYSRAERSTLSDAADRWLRARRPNVGAKTYARYEGIVRDYIKPTIGDVQLRKLTPLHVEDAIAKWRAVVPKKRLSGTLGQRSLHHNFCTLNTMLKQAVRWNMLPRNPCDAVISPSKGRADVVALDESQAVLLLESIRDTSLAPIVHFALHTGSRRGEILALRWSDIDFERHVARIRRSLEQLENGRCNFKETKTKRSRRLIPLTAETIEMLKAHRAEQNAIRLQVPGYNSAGLAFPEPGTGQPWGPDRFSRVFSRRIAKLGIRVSFHGLRHSFATIALRVGVPMKVVSDMLGHTTMTITADLYTHVLDDTRRQGADSVALALSAAGGRGALPPDQLRIRG